ncbi:MAG TPA: alanine--tRNA ligase [Verrucomicrobiota bacterium]|nr:alanine--tRNA ligase [Verrucomicrobiota bacterium]HQL77746.1 alanine--tRNA ligase [Verrucomicrobiota bacterium]
MTSAEIRRSFLDFFKSKGHTIVPSSSLMPGSPNLLFTNAGMNQFVPIFLGQRAPDVSKWAGAVAASDTRAADTQKCIRAGGKHNDLEDVGLDTYHHTFFEMLGNWSFGDYFKQEAICWAWELITEVWKFPANRLYATVYSPDKAKGDPAEFDREAYDVWAEKFRAAGLAPKDHVLSGNRKDNFWMMGDTGPCGPCSELHVDLTPNGDSRGSLVNKSDARCIEIWNLVFIQFNANPDGSFSPLPARHVDTGMGFERVTGIIQNTKNFTDFTRVISNYETDIFRPIFDKIEKLSGRKYHSTLPPASSIRHPTADIQADIAFRVIADHIRTLSFAIADGIQPGNTDRNYVLRRILRRAVRYGRTLGFHEPFFYKLVAVLAETMGQAFPELRARQDHIEQVIQREEEAFNKTLDRGIELFCEQTEQQRAGQLSGEFAFKLYDTYGFPLDLTELMARERGLAVDVAGFNRLMEEQKARARAAQKKQVIELSQVETTTPTQFVGYDKLESPAKVLEVVAVRDKTAVILDVSPLYAEMGGQVGDTGEMSGAGELWTINNTQKAGDAWLHFLADDAPPGAQHEPPSDAPRSDAPLPGCLVTLTVDRPRREAIQRHHTVTHLLHWALHEVVSKDASQKGSYVGPEKLTFDFSGAALTPQQVADVERLVNERILENAPVSWTEASYSDIKNRKDIRQFFGEKYGEVVRVLQIGGKPGALDGYSMELCGGTHARATGEIGLFRIAAESAIAAGVRRIEALAGMEAYRRAAGELQLIRAVAGKVNSPVAELEKKIESLLAQQKTLEKQLLALDQERAARAARDILSRAQTINGTPAIIERFDADGDKLQGIANELKGQFKGVIVLGGVADGAVALIASVSPEFTRQHQAGKIIQTIAPVVGGKGGGRPDNARGGGKDATRLDEALAKARSLLG